MKRLRRVVPFTLVVLLLVSVFFLSRNIGFASTTPIFICGAEEGAVLVGASGFTRHWDAIVGVPTADSTTFRSGVYAWRFNCANAAISMQKTIATSTLVGRIFFYFKDALPDEDTQIIRLSNASGNYVIIFDVSGANLKAQVGTGTVIEGPVVTYNTWYRIDLYGNSTANPGTLDWQIDGVAQTQATTAQAAAGFTSILFGCLGSPTADVYADDIILSATSGDYPFGDGKVLGYSPNVDGTHSFTLNNFLYNAAGGSIATDATDVYTYLNELPVETSVGDFINQALADADEYVEIGFADTAETTNARGLEVISAHHSATTSTSRQYLYLNDGGTLGVALDNGNPAVNTTLKYNSLQFASAPSTGEWTQAKINALKARWGYSSDAIPNTYVDWVFLEVEWAVGGGTPTPTPSKHYGFIF